MQTNTTKEPANDNGLSLFQAAFKMIDARNIEIERQIALNNLQAINSDFSTIQQRMNKDVRDYQAGHK